MAEHTSSSVLTAPLRGAASLLSKVPGASAVNRAAQDTLDVIGVISPRGRRLAVYTGAGVLGVAGVVEWPVALTGAAIAWLTQPRPPLVTPVAETTEVVIEEPAPAGEAEVGDAALHAGHHDAPGPVKATDTGSAHPESAHPESHKKHGKKSGKHSKGATGQLGPTARPERTSL
ncbi:hypothetical protein ACFV1A_10695 [Streptomyces seoulensis]|uniref:Uncharacterized protein n=1 Tax=Streptomyces seoulensis TaxID=73044 RepID=A0A4P6TQ14_STRSO|nr:hypothetical protein [Streptomyces seoulensis]QBJ89270.1 hypothetical protein D0Z67_02395 [Streptomyces seoulensis]